MKLNKPNKIITHTAASSKHHTAKSVGQWHFERWGGYAPSSIRDDIVQYAGYHYIIEWDGTVEKCRAITDEGIHCKGQNFSSIGICFMGNFDEHMPSKAQEEAFVKLYRDIGKNMPIYPHRKYANKSCHGKLLSDDYFAKLVNRTYKETKLEQLKMLLNRLYTLLARQRMK